MHICANTNPTPTGTYLCAHPNADTRAHPHTRYASSSSSATLKNV